MIQKIIKTSYQYVTASSNLKKIENICKKCKPIGYKIVSVACKHHANTELMISAGRLVMNPQDPPPCLGSQANGSDVQSTTLLSLPTKHHKARFSTVLPDFGKNILGGGGGAAFSVPQLTQAKWQLHHTVLFGE